MLCFDKFLILMLKIDFKKFPSFSITIENYYYYCFDGKIDLCLQSNNDTCAMCMPVILQTNLYIVPANRLESKNNIY